MRAYVYFRSRGFVRFIWLAHFVFFFFYNSIIISRSVDVREFLDECDIGFVQREWTRTQIERAV